MKGAVLSKGAGLSKRVQMPQKSLVVLERAFNFKCFSTK